MILSLCRVEFLKIRRSLVLLMTLACPLAIVVLVFGANLRGTSPATMTPAKLSMLWASVSAMWSWFMLPLYVALATSLVNGNEHRNQTWRLMLSLPIRRGDLYAAKAIVAVLLMLAAHAALLGFVVLAMGVLGLVGFPLAGAFDVQPAVMLWGAPVAALPLLVVQHALSWRLRSIVPPLAVAVVATLAAIQLGQSELWPLIPWSYPVVATNAAAESARMAALIGGPALAAVLFVLSAWWLGRREVV